MNQDSKITKKLTQTQFDHFDCQNHKSCRYGTGESCLEFASLQRREAKLRTAAKGFKQWASSTFSDHIHP